MKRYFVITTVLITVACSGGGASKSTPPSTASAPAPATGNSNSGAASLSIFPPKLVTGFDGTHTFQAPASLVGGSGATWSADDVSLVTLAPTSDGTHVMITAKKAGSTNINATVGGKKVSVPITINSYTAAQYTAGETRYKTDSATSGKACASCHQATGGSAPDHTPTELVADTDDEVINTFKTGTDPEGVPVPAPNHKFAVSAAEQAGLVAYLRALKPSGYPDPNK